MAASKSASKRIGVGVIGANPDRGWALSAHLPALRAMSGDFEIAAVSTTRQETADRTAASLGAANAYDDWHRLVVDPNVDVVAVCVKVEHHRELALGAIEAGKHVFCEWPLALDTTQAREIASAAERRGVRTVVGLQGRASPYVNAVRELVTRGAVGRIISATLISSLNNWGPSLPASEAYRTRRESGATGLTVPGGHSLDTFCHCLGEFAELSAIVTTQDRTCTIVETGKVVDVTSPDQVLVSGRLRNGAVASVHIKVDMASPTGVLLQINGTDGDIVVTTRPPVGVSPVGIQRTELDIRIARGRKSSFVDVTDVGQHSRVPATVPAGPPFYTAQLYARLRDALRCEAELSPSFADAVIRHRLLDAVQRASDTGMRQSL